MFSSLVFSSYAATCFLFNAALGASLVRVPSFGSPDPSSKLEMWIYIPDKVAPQPPVIMALHGCGGSATMEKSIARDYIAAADTKGHIMIIPQTKADNNCWDVGSPRSLKHDGGGDTHILATMIKYTIQKHNGDAKRVFVTGTSSGAMMANVMCAVYPDLINAGAAFSGVAAGCFDHSKYFNPMTANRTCTDGKVHKSGPEWAAQVRSFYPGYTGSYPRMSIWHGTADGLIKYAVMKDTMLEWSELHGVTWTKNVSNSPQAGYTQMVYGDGTKVVGYSAQGVGHTVPEHGAQVMAFWGI